jgi:predicted HD phosphohydrolase
VVALLHDIGDPIAPDNHSEVAAAILRPYVSDDNTWLLKHHGVFQGYYYFDKIGQDRDARERFRSHPCCEKTVMFCERWDQTSFDPDYDTLPLETFEPMVRRIFARKPRGFVSAEQRRDGTRARRYGAPKRARPLVRPPMRHGSGAAPDA